MREPSRPVVAATNSSIFQEHRRTWQWVTLACLVVGGFFLLWHGPMPFEGLLRSFIAKDAWVEGRSFGATPASVRHYLSLSAALMFFSIGLLFLAAGVWTRLSEGFRWRLYDIFFTLAITCSVMVFLFHMEFEAPWLPLGANLHHPGTLPVFGHRLLFVWVARIVQLLHPGLSDLRAFYLSQAVAIMLALYALGRWSELYVGRALSWAGQLVGAVLIASTFDYYNFYDVGTVLFSTCALIAIHTRRYWWLVPVVIVGTLNYEGILLLILLAAFMAYDERPVKNWLVPVLVSLVGYCAVRFAWQEILPMQRHVDWRVWSNIVHLFVTPAHTAYSILVLGGWYCVGLMSLTWCEPRLRRLVLLFPLLLGTTYLFGQFHEPRQFNAFIPVVVALLLSASARRSQAEEEGEPLPGIC